MRWFILGVLLGFYVGIGLAVGIVVFIMAMLGASWRGLFAACLCPVAWPLVLWWLKYL